MSGPPFTGFGCRCHKQRRPESLADDALNGADRLADLTGRAVAGVDAPICPVHGKPSLESTANAAARLRAERRAAADARAAAASRRLAAEIAAVIDADRHTPRRQGDSNKTDKVDSHGVVPLNASAADFAAHLGLPAEADD